jgi:Fatty acid hydroxylase superfamily
VLPAAVTDFRVEYRRTEIGPSYRGWLHFALTSVTSLCVIGLSVSRVRDVQPWELCVIPATFLFANFTEFTVHRGPMHRPAPGLGLLFQRHTREHHHYFTHEAMSFESSKDFKMVLFPPIMLVFFLGVIATPLAVVLFFVASSNVAWLYVTVAMSYFLTYEWLHFAYHLPPDSWAGRLPFVAALRRHHTRHHDLSLMGKHNFNITFPIFDWLRGTLYRPPG